MIMFRRREVTAAGSISSPKPAASDALDSKPERTAVTTPANGDAIR